MARGFLGVMPGHVGFLDAIERAAGPVSPHERPRFLAELAAQLERAPVLGPGVMPRVGAELQRRFPVEARAAAELVNKGYGPHHRSASRAHKAAPGGASNRFTR